MSAADWTLLAVLAGLLLIAAVVLIGLFRAITRDDRRQASKVIALRSITTYVSVPTPVDAYGRDEYGRPY